jgi:hypothetical protein
MIPIGTLVELASGVRLFVAAHDGAVYHLSVEKPSPFMYPDKFIRGYPREKLTPCQ